MTTELPATPYINASELKAFTGRTVRLISQFITVYKPCCLFLGVDG
jgi:hypothetical protein